MVSRAGWVGGGAPNQDSYQRSFFMTVGMKQRWCSDDEPLGLRIEQAYLSGVQGETRRSPGAKPDIRRDTSQHAVPRQAQKHDRLCPGRLGHLDMRMRHRGGAAVIPELAGWFGDAFRSDAQHDLSPIECVAAKRSRQRKAHAAI